METIETLIEQLNAPSKEKRLEALEKLTEMIKNGEIPMPRNDFNDVNNHIHTTYSFSPYSPTKAVWCGYMAGLKTVGIMDHDSVSGCEEFVQACKIMNIAGTCGMELRTSFKNTPLNGRMINNPDQETCVYTAFHGIPHTQFGKVKTFIKPYLTARIKREQQMLEKINEIMNPLDIYVDFDKDVVPLSMFHELGSITERHLLFAVSQKIIDKFGKGPKVVDFLKNSVKINISQKVADFLSDAQNPYYIYDLLGAMKSDMVQMFYIPATDECPEIADVIAFSKKIGSFMAYPYLGDVTNSVTGDKKQQKFEDDYLDELFEVLSTLGFNAITYMPSRNTDAQLDRLREKCVEYNLFQISGEDINTPRQSFICMTQRDPKFANLVDAAWALIGAENAATQSLSLNFFSEKTVNLLPDLNKRTAYFKELGLKSI